MMIMSQTKIIPQGPILKPQQGSHAFYAQNLRNFSQFIAKFRLDNTTGIRYLNPSRLLPQYSCCFITAPTSYWNVSY